MPEIIYGREIAKKIRDGLNKKIAELCGDFRPPGLAVIIAGIDEASIYYAEIIEKAAKKEGIEVFINHIKKPTTSSLADLITELNSNENIDGILVQLPLPDGIDRHVIFDTLLPEKDVDGQTPVNMGRLAVKQKSIVPATALAVVKLLKANFIVISGKSAVVVGRSTAVGLPVAMLLIHENATVRICHSKSRPLEKYTLNADILVVSCGKPNLITKKYVKVGAVVIDVGTNVNEVDGKMVGDVDFESVIKIASVSPVIGGVGAVTLACLFENTYELYRKNIYRK